MSSGLISISIGIYLIMLILLAYFSKQGSSHKTLKDYYLAGNGLGTFVLLFTLYATQYSANTMLVVPAEVVNKGLGMILVLGYMSAIIVFYLSFAPALYRISRKEKFITPGDWINYRYRLPSLTLLANIVFLVVSLNFLLAQLMAMGYITSSISNGQIPYWVGVIALSIIVIIYETIGGMKAVAWTDVLQGGMLLLGLVGIFIIVNPTPHHLREVSEWLIQNEPEKIQVPKLDFRIYWASTVLMIGMGAAVYPQAIQRIYAARSVAVLKKSISFMVFLPLLTILILFLLGFISIPYYTEVEAVSRDAVLPEMLVRWSSQSNLALVLTMMVTVGLLAAIMSTADSVLLTMSSIITKDLLGNSKRNEFTEQTLTRYGKLISFGIMLFVTLWALQPGITLWGLIELKMQILVQIAPLFIIGLSSKRWSGKGMLVGILIGLAFSMTTFFLGYKTLGNIQSGLIGLALNIFTAWVLSNTILPPKAEN